MSNDVSPTDLFLFVGVSGPSAILRGFPTASHSKILIDCTRNSQEETYESVFILQDL